VTLRPPATLSSACFVRSTGSSVVTGTRFVRSTGSSVVTGACFTRSTSPMPPACARFALAAASLPLRAMSDDAQDPPLDDDDAPVDVGDERPRFTPEEVSAWLARPEVVARMRAAIAAASSKKLSTADADDIYQTACDKALTANKRPFVDGNTVAWFGRVAANATIDHFRDGSDDKDNLNRSKDVERLPIRPEDDPLADLATSEGLQAWLQKRVSASPSDKETLDLIERKAREKLTSAELAKLVGITENAFDKRVQALKKKYGPARTQYKKRLGAFLFTLKVVVATAVVVAVVLFAWWWLRKDDMGPDPSARQPLRQRAVPSADAAPVPTFDQALPAPEGGVRLKP
jgi:DNA-directed RNA polymerase specialized sigma24 family protein